jgi:hypothetical protein
MALQGYAAVALVLVTASGAAAQVRVSGDKVAFPEHFAHGALYTTVDRADNKQFRELYVSPESAIAAANRGEPLLRQAESGRGEIKPASCRR